MNHGIIVAGNILADIIKDIDAYPEHSNLTTVRRINRFVGGLLCNCAIDIARLDPSIPVTAVGRVGADELGGFLMEEMRRYPSVSMSGVRKCSDCDTSFTDVFFDTANKTRTFFTYRGANDLLSPSDFDFDRLKGDILHIGYILLLDALDREDPEYGTAMARVLCSAKEHGIKTSIDLVSEKGDRYETLVPPALKYTDYCVINETEASRVTGMPILDDEGNLIEARIPAVCGKLFDLGVSEWVIIHSKYCSYGMDREGHYYTLASLDIPKGLIADTTGAGDAYASGVLVAAYYGEALPEAMRLATAAASCSILKKGSNAGVLTKEKALEFYHSYPEPKSSEEKFDRS